MERWKDRNNFLFCDISKEKCIEKNLDSDEKIKLLGDKIKINNVNYYFAGKSYKNYIEGTGDLQNKKISSYKIGNLRFYFLGDPIITSNLLNKSIEIEINNLGDKPYYTNHHNTNF